MRLSLTPRTNEIYDLFSAAGQNAAAAASLAAVRFRELPPTPAAQAAIKGLEHEGDRILGDIFHCLNTQYVTPFDREDVFGLAHAIDDVVDHIEQACDLLGLYRIERPSPAAIAQCDVLVDATRQLAAASGALRDRDGIGDRLDAITQLERDGDRIVRAAIAELFADESVTTRTIVRWKDIHEALEEAIDACETAAHVIGNVVVKNS